VLTGFSQIVIWVLVSECDNLEYCDVTSMKS